MTAETTTTVRYGFHKADFEDWFGWGTDESVDDEASFDAYIEQLHMALMAAFPGAEVEIDWDINTTGALPYGLKPSVNGETDAVEVATVLAIVERVGNDIESWVVRR